jgi:hypothetical protein
VPHRVRADNQCWIIADNGILIHRALSEIAPALNNIAPGLKRIDTAPASIGSLRVYPVFLMALYAACGGETSSLYSPHLTSLQSWRSSLLLRGGVAARPSSLEAPALQPECASVGFAVVRAIRVLKISKDGAFAESSRSSDHEVSWREWREL